MNHKPYFILTLMILIWLLAACVSASGPGGISCQNGICVDVQLSEPIRFNETMTVTITVETERDEKDVQIGLSCTDPTVIFEGGPRPWMADIKAHQPTKFTRTIRFPAPDRAGNIHIVGGAKTWSGAYSGDDVIVYTTPEEASLDPTIMPQTPEPLPPMPGSALPTPSPPNIPPTPWERTVTYMKYKPAQAMSFCGWNAQGDVALWKEDIKVWAEIPENVPLNTPVAVVIGWKGQRSLTQPVQIQAAVCPTDPSIRVEGQHEWTVAVKADSRFTTTVTVRFTALGEFAVLGVVYDPAGNRIQDAGQLTRVVAETSQLLNQPTSGWQTIMTQDFEGAWPWTAPNWDVDDLSTDGKDRWWEDDEYKAHNSMWAAWPAKGGADGIDPAPGNDHYPNYMDTRMFYGPFDLSDATVAQVNFWLWREVQVYYDCLTLEASHDGVTFQTIRTWCDNDPDWRAYNEVTFNDYTGDTSVWIAWRFSSNVSVTYQGPWLDDILLWKYVPGQVSVHGSLAYADRANHSQPARYLKAYLYDADPGGTDDLLSETIVGSSGTFAFVSVRNWDDDAGQSTSERRLDLYVVWKTEYDDSNMSQRRVTDFSDNVYKYYSSTYTDVSDGSADFNFLVPFNHPKREAMWIFQELRKGWDYIYGTTGTDPESVTAHWESGQNSYSVCNASCFNPFVGVFIAHNETASQDILLHELGHQYMYNAQGLWVSLCGNHGMFEVSDYLCAWTEGWAEFFPVAVNPLGVNADTCYDWGPGPCGTGGNPFENLETQNPSDGRSTGDMVEGRVAGALYDLFDTMSDGYDHAGFGFSPIWTIIGDNTSEDRFGMFWLTWRALGYNSHDAVQSVFQNTIDYDDPPQIQLPDVTVFKDMVINNVLDLWNYSSDSESRDVDLTWSVVGMSNGSCGVAVQGHYIATAPQAGFLGSCDITVRVDDKLKTSDDEFTVHVVEVQARSFLPVVLKSTVAPLQSPLISPSPFVSPLPVPAQTNPFVSPLPNPITP